MSDRAWETLTSEITYACDGFDVVSETVELPSGDRAEFDYLSERESVVVLPFTSDGEVVVVDEWRHAVGRENRAIPAGSVEDDEPPETAARRELREETGYEAGTVDPLCAFEPANGFSDAYFRYYVARECTPTSSQSLDRDETIEVTTTTFEALRSGVRSGDLADGRTALGVLYYALFETADG